MIVTSMCRRPVAGLTSPTGVALTGLVAGVPVSRLGLLPVPISRVNKRYAGTVSSKRPERLTRNAAIDKAMQIKPGNANANSSNRTQTGSAIIRERSA